MAKPKKNARLEGETSASDNHEDFQPTEHLRPLTNDPNKTAFENGVPCSDYAQRVLSMQGRLEPNTVKIGNVERALRRQGYPLAEIREATEVLYQALNG